jgi:hypothetical protein
MLVNCPKLAVGIKLLRCYAALLESDFNSVSELCGVQILYMDWKEIFDLTVLLDISPLT